MVKIEKNKSYQLKFGKSGTSANGPWEMLVIKDEAPKGRKEITVWTVGAPCGAEKDDYITITDILSVNYGAKKDAAGNWVDQVSANCKVIKGAAAFGSNVEDLAAKAPGIVHTDDWSDMPDSPDLPF